VKIFGIGFSRTGTSTLSECLRILGYSHVKYREDLLMQIINNRDLGNTYDVVDQFDSFSDWPWPLIYQDLDKRYPDSKFILTIRKDPETWIRSFYTLARMRPHSKPRELIFEYDTPIDHESEYIARYEEHNREVQDYFKDKLGKLLVCCWENGTGWKEISGFLGREIPKQNLPHLNKSVRMNA